MTKGKIDKEVANYVDNSAVNVSEGSSGPSLSFLGKDLSWLGDSWVKWVAGGLGLWLLSNASDASADTGQSYDPGTFANLLPAQGRQYADAITRAANNNGLPPAIVAATVSRESNFRNGVIGDPEYGGSGGLMQINFPSHPDYDRSRINDVDYNLDYGARLLASLYRQARNKGITGNDAYLVMFAAYNRGSVDKAYNNLLAGNVDLNTADGNYATDSLRRAQHYGL